MPAYNYNPPQFRNKPQPSSGGGLDFELARKRQKEREAQFARQAQSQQVPATQFPTEEPPEIKQSFMNRLAGFLGAEKLGQGIASALRVGTKEINQTGDQEAAAVQQLNAIMQNYAPGSPERKRAFEQFNRVYQGGIPTQTEIDPGTGLSNKEIIGSAASTALNVAAPTAFSGGLAARAAKSAAVGAGFGVASGLNDKADVAGIIKSAFTGSLIGGAIPVVGAGISKVSNKLKKVFSEKLPESLMNHAVKPTLNELKRNIKIGSPTLGKELLKEGVAGSPEKLLKISESRLNSVEDELQTVLAKSTNKLSSQELRPYFEDMIKTLRQTPGSKDAVLVAETLLADVPQQMDLQTANIIKRNLYNRLRDVAYKLDPNLSDKAQAMKVLARGLKTEIESKSSDPALVKALNERLSIYGRLEDRVLDILARDSRNKIVSLTDTIAGSAGFINPLAWLGLLVKKFYENEAALTYSAKALSKTGKIGTGNTVKAVKEITKRALYNTP